MRVAQDFEYESQIREALKNLKMKKVLYLYDDFGNRELVGVFSRGKVEQVKRHFRGKKLINRLAEFEIRTTEPDSVFKC